MASRGWLIGGVGVAAVAAWFFLFRGKEQAQEIEYRYSPVSKGELIRSISATGQLVALTSVDVKSKAGGKVVKLLVEEGREVKAGETIALIDPADTESTFKQAEADLRSAQARAEQSRNNLALTRAQSVTAVADARVALEAARVRLQRVEIQAGRQPQLTKSNLASAMAGHQAALQNLNKVRDVTIPSQRRDAQVSLQSARTSMEVAKSDYDRQMELLAKGYVSQSTADRARQSYESAKAAYDNAQQRMTTIEQELSLTLKAAQAQEEQARASLELAKTNASQDSIAKQDLAESRNAVRQAEINLQKAQDSVRNNDIRANDVTSAQASTVRSQVALANAKVQLDSTTVVAPRDGVVTTKYLEEGTIIPPGTSTFAQGTSLIQISDISRMFVECAVDEADIGSVRKGQKVRIRTEAYPSSQLEGTVVRVNPSATTAQNITAVKVRVEVQVPKEKGVRLLPGMNATCEFITLSLPDVLIAPGQAIQREGDKTFVKVKGKDPKKPEKREVKLGEAGNNGVQVLSGLKPDEEVVTAEIDLAAMRETQQKMVEAMQGGGLAGGGMGGRPSTGNRGATGGGGARTGGTGGR